MRDLLTANEMQWIEETWKKLDEKLSVVTLRSRDKLPFCTKTHYMAIGIRT